MPDLSTTHEYAYDEDSTDVDKNGNRILSKAIRDEQKAEGYVPDIQPKCSPHFTVPITGVAGSPADTVVGAAPAASPEAEVEVKPKASK